MSGRGLINGNSNFLFVVRNWRVIKGINNGRRRPVNKYKMKVRSNYQPCNYSSAFVCVSNVGRDWKSGLRRECIYEAGGIKNSEGWWHVFLFRTGLYTSLSETLVIWKQITIVFGDTMLWLFWFDYLRFRDRNVVTVHTNCRDDSDIIASPVRNSSLLFISIIYSRPRTSGRDIKWP